MLFGSLSLHEDKIRGYKDDLESLYYTMLYLAGVKLPWEHPDNEACASYKKRIQEIRVSKIYVVLTNKKYFKNIFFTGFGSENPKSICSTNFLRFI